MRSRRGRGWATTPRAVRLHAIARQAVAELGGKLPETLEGLMALKGIGRYTAGAVACFAYELPVATVDTNIRRVLWRLLRGIEPVPWPAGEAASRVIFALAEAALPLGRAYDWQQALMDLGATICAARRPLCEQCPVASCCAALQETARETLFASGEALARIRDERAMVATSGRGDEEGAGGKRVAEARASYDAKPAKPRGTSGGKSGAPARASCPSSRPHATSAGRIVDALRSLALGESLPLAGAWPAHQA